jgi:hypothetical protein
VCAAEGVTNIVNLQEDKDFAYWGVDFGAYSRRATELGMFLDRRPVCSPQQRFFLHQGHAAQYKECLDSDTTTKAQARTG